MQNEYDTIIIGAGLAGLSCATKLTKAGKSVVVLEATDRVGGRVRTDVVDGYSLDHGFQVLLTAYPACQELLDYDALRMRTFDPGALVRSSGKFSHLGDPWQKPSQALGTLLSPVGSMGDKLRIAKLRSTSSRGSLDDLYQRPHQRTSDRLQAAGFSSAMVDQFFRPFLGGVFLDESLSVSSRMLEFVFRMFATGDIAIPADGMGAIPRQLADALPQGTIRLTTTVTSLNGSLNGRRRSVQLSSGDELVADNVVVATESSTAARLLGVEALDTQWNAATTFYFITDQAPNDSKLLMLRGDETGPVQSAVVISNVAKEYAPTGKSLVSVSVSDAHHDDESESIEAAIRAQMMNWFGSAVQNWKCLQVYRVPYGLPKLDLETVLGPVDNRVTAIDNVFVCGDHVETPSIQGAMNSGIRTAAAILT